MLGAFRRNLHTITSAGKYTPEFKKYLVDAKGHPQSFFHDVPLNYNREEGTVNMIVEIPRYEQGKFEISKELPLNPIVQDTKKENSDSSITYIHSTDILAIMGRFLKLGRIQLWRLMPMVENTMEIMIRLIYVRLAPALINLSPSDR